MAPTVDHSQCARAGCHTRASKSFHRRLDGAGETFRYCSAEHKQEDRKRCERRNGNVSTKAHQQAAAPQAMKAVTPVNSKSAASGPSSANLEPGKEITGSENVTQQLEMHSNQPAVDNVGPKTSLGEAEEDNDSDESGSIIYTPKGSGKENEGHKVWGSDKHCRIM